MYIFTILWQSNGFLYFQRGDTMSHKERRSGGKVGGTHGTCIPIVAKIIDEAEKCAYIQRISLGVIIPGQGSSGGKRRAKINIREGWLLLKVRATGALQHVRVYVTDTPHAIAWLREHLRDLGVEVTVGNTS